MSEIRRTKRREFKYQPSRDVNYDICEGKEGQKQSFNDFLKEIKVININAIHLNDKMKFQKAKELLKESKKTPELNEERKFRIAKEMLKKEKMATFKSENKEKSIEKNRDRKTRGKSELNTPLKSDHSIKPKPKTEPNKWDHTPKEKEKPQENKAIPKERIPNKPRVNLNKIPQRSGDIKVIDPHSTKKESLRVKQPYGYIYLGINKNNGKVYVGQTITERHGKNKVPIAERWKEHIKEADALINSQKAYPEKKISGLRLINALLKHRAEAFTLKQIDTAKNQSELNEKEIHYISKYDSMNPDKGYNMTEGGEGGRMSPEIIERIKINTSLAITEKWKDSKYQEKQRKGVKEKWKNPIYQKKQKKGVEEKWKDPVYREKHRKIRKGTKYRDNISQAKKKDWQDPNYKRKLQEIMNSSDYKEKQRIAAEKRLINPEYRERHKLGVKMRWNDPMHREKMKNIQNSKEVKTKKSIKMTENWQDPNYKGKMEEIMNSLDYKEKQRIAAEKRWKDPAFREKHKKSMEMHKKMITNKKEFLMDIKNMQKKDMIQKYKMDGKTINKRIKEIFEPIGFVNYTEVKNYLKDKKIDDILNRGF